MAKDALVLTGIPLQPAGMNDNSPLSSDPDYYQTRGTHSISELCLQRCNGKQLLRKFDTPILGIHGDIKGFIFVETVDTLYMLTAGELLPPDDTITFNDTPSVHWSLPSTVTFNDTSSVHWSD